jgi:hypothetical protein
MIQNLGFKLRAVDLIGHFENNVSRLQALLQLRPLKLGIIQLSYPSFEHFSSPQLKKTLWHKST